MLANRAVIDLRSKLQIEPSGIDYDSNAQWVIGIGLCSSVNRNVGGSECPSATQGNGYCELISIPVGTAIRDVPVGGSHSTPCKLLSRLDSAALQPQHVAFVEIKNKSLVHAFTSFLNSVFECARAFLAVFAS